MNKSNGSIGTESCHSSDSGCYNNSYSNGPGSGNGHNYNNLINQLLPNSIKNGLNNFVPKTAAASMSDQFDVITFTALLCYFLLVFFSYLNFKFIRNSCFIDYNLLNNLFLR